MLLRLLGGLAVAAGVVVGTIVVRGADQQRALAREFDHAFRTHPREAVEPLREALAISADPQPLIRSLRTTLRRLVETGAYDPNAKLLHKTLWEAGVRDAEMVELEELLYRETQTGKAWGYFTNRRILFMPAIVEGAVLFSHDSSLFSALEIDTKRARTHAADMHVPVHSHLLATADRVIFASLSGTLHCRLASDLSKAWSARIADRLYDSPLIAADDRRVYVLWGAGKACHLQAFDLLDGAPAWGPFKVEGEAPVALAADGSAVVAQSGAGLAAFAAADGAPLFRRDARGPGLLLDAGRVVVADHDRAVALVAATGAVEWTRPLPSPAAQAPVALEERAVFALQEGAIVCLDLRKGTEVWRAAPGGRVTAPLAASRGQVFAIDDQNHVIAVSIRNGALLRYGDKPEGPGPLGILVHAGKAIVFSEIEGSHAIKIHVFDTGDRKAGGWTQRGGGPGRQQANR
jgi:outer membrane protein assembly factor BamB